MPILKSPISAFEVKRLYDCAANSTRHAVGGVSGLELQKSRSGSCSWVLRTLINNKRKEIGLGGFPSVSLKQAREDAQKLKTDIRNGIDPTKLRAERRQKAILASKLELTFKIAVERYLSIKLKEFRNEKHKKQWYSTLSTYAILLNDMKVSDIDTNDILKILEPIWLEKNETANRLRGRIEAILDWAKFHGHRTGENPARWRGNLELALQKPSAVKQVKNHPALTINDAPIWYYCLKQRDGIGALALEFLSLTLVRSGEARGAVWSEIEDDIWIIPANRTKTKTEYRIPLSTRARDLLTELDRGQELLFPNKYGRELSDASLLTCMKRIHYQNDDRFVDRHSGRPAVPHGLRSTFRDWVTETTEYPSEIAEIALGHKVGNAVERAYRRGDMLKKRQMMMEDWGKFLMSATND